MRFKLGSISCYNLICCVYCFLASGKVVIRTVRNPKIKDLELVPPLKRVVVEPLAPPRLPNSRPPLPHPTRVGWLNLLAFGLVLLILASGAFLDVLINGGVEYGNDLPHYSYTSVGDLGANPLGVNTFLQLETDDISKIGRSLDMIKAGGFGFVRQEFPWQDIEPAPKHFFDQNGLDTWLAFDQIVNGAAARGLQIVARVDKAPAWTRQQIYDAIDTGDPSCPERNGPPQNYDDYGDFLTQLATRYKGKLKYYQIWNEPNLHGEWNCQKVDAAAYTRLLKIAYTRLKAVDPNIVVLAAALSPTDVLEPLNNDRNELDYLDKMYQAGAKNYFDIMSAQIYGLGYGPDYRYVEPDLRYKDFRRTNFSRTWLLHDVMVQNGDTQKSVWASEYGWVSIPPNWPGNYQQNWGNSIDEQTQANYLVGGLERARQEWPWLGVTNVWFFRPDPALAQKSNQDPTNFFAIVNPDFTPRPAYTALKNYTADAYKTATTGFHSATDPAISYRGDWQDGKAKNGSSLVFSFRGDRAEVLLKQLVGGQVEFKLDGVAAGGLGSYDNLNETRVTLAENLPGGPDQSHRVELIFKSNPVVTAPLVQIQGFLVERVNYFGWLFLVFYALCAVGLLIAGGLLIPRLVRNGRQLAVYSYVGMQSGVVWTVGRTRSRTLAGWNWLKNNQTRLGIWGLQGLMAGTLAVFYLAGVWWLSLAGLVLFMPFAWVFPQTALGLAVATAPLQFHPHNFRTEANPLEFGLNEVIILETALVWAAQAVWAAVRRRSLSSSTNAPSLPVLLPSVEGAVVLKKNSILRFIRAQGPFVLPLALFFVLACASLLVPEPSHLKEALREFRLVIVEPLLLFFLVLHFIKRSQPAFYLLDFLVLSAVVISCIGLWQFGFTKGDTTIQAEGVSRVVGVYPHPDNLGLFLGRAIPIVVAVVFFYEGGWVWRRRLYTLALLPLLAVLILSFSRGAWLAVLVSLFVMIIVAGSRRGLLLFGGAAVLGLIALPFIKLERVTSLFSFVTGSNATRLNVWQSSLQMIHDHPFTGIGLDQFLYKYSVEYVKPQAWLERFISHPHNLIFDYWLRLGIIGPVVLIWLLFSFFKLTLTIRQRLIRPAPERADSQTNPIISSQRVLALALFGTMADFAVHGLVDNSYFLIDLAIIFWLSFSLLEILRRETFAEADKEHL